MPKRRCGIMGLMGAMLPEGWTLSRIQTVAGCPTAEFMPTSVVVFVEAHPVGETVSGQERLRLELIIRLDDYALVKPVDDPDWYIGFYRDGAVVCWASYGPDLDVAIQAL
jgi:hypothetical protein